MNCTAALGGIVISWLNENTILNWCNIRYKIKQNKKWTGEKEHHIGKYIVKVWCMLFLKHIIPMIHNYYVLCVCVRSSATSVPG